MHPLPPPAYPPHPLPFYWLWSSPSLAVSLTCLIGSYDVFALVPVPVPVPVPACTCITRFPPKLALVPCTLQPALLLQPAPLLLPAARSLFCMLAPASCVFCLLCFSFTSLHVVYLHELLIDCGKEGRHRVVYHTPTDWTNPVVHLVFTAEGYRRSNDQ